jgi:hypothetical protein
LFKIVKFFHVVVNVGVDVIFSPISAARYSITLLEQRHELCAKAVFLSLNNLQRNQVHHHLSVRVSTISQNSANLLTNNYIYQRSLHLAAIIASRTRSSLPNQNPQH